MRHLAVFAILLCLAAAAPAPAAAQSGAEQARIRFAIERGRLLFELDRAAWVGTDDMMERIRDASSSGMRGYVVERDGAGYAVTFFGGPEDAPVAFYRGRVENRRVVGREIFPATARPALTPAQRRLAAIRLMAAGLGRRPCGDQPFNTAAIPPETEGAPIDLYLLTPQVRRDAWPLGGHYRATINADGTVASSRAFMNSCMEMARREGALAFVVSHLLDPVPTEIHVFTALTSGVQLYVAAGGATYRVDGDSISQIDAPGATPPKT